jgi:hypothetical protein
MKQIQMHKTFYDLLYINTWENCSHMQNMHASIDGVFSLINDPCKIERQIKTYQVAKIIIFRESFRLLCTIFVLCSIYFEWILSLM